MKRLFIIVYCLSFVIPGFSEHIPYFGKGQSKLFLNSSCFPEVKPTYYELICTDSYVEDEVTCYEIVTRTYLDYPEVYQDSDPYFQYEDNGKVFYYYKDTIKILLMDFTLKPGDLINLDDMCTLSEEELFYCEMSFVPMIVLDEGYIEVNGVKRRAIEVSKFADYPVVGSGFLWVEGVGPFNPRCKIPNYPIPTNGITPELVGCYKDGKCIFRAEDFEKYISDSAINDPDLCIHETFTHSQESCDGIYNLQGMRIADSSTNLHHGVYIVRQGDTIKKLLITAK